ncbi:MAG: hypothetical protein N4Q18_10720 [Lactobacillus crispatus]|nr:hypothetical protein [Lactobacillus crispatus]
MQKHQLAKIKGTIIQIATAGLAPSEPMSFEEVDHLRANPKYKYIYEAWVKFTKGEITEETFKRI